MDENTLLKTAEDILASTSELSEQLKDSNIAPPKNLDIGATSNLWTTHDEKLDALKAKITALTQNLGTLLEGPHGFLHEYVSVNWEHGALYTLLDHNVLEHIPLDGSTIPIANLGQETGLPADKLLRICRLVATTGILREPTEGEFGHTAISETLVKDKGYKSFIGFQLFETRVASAHLADSLRKPNPFWTGEAAFELAWGMPMYDWHRKNPEKGKRFAAAMGSVSKSLDAGNDMIMDWIKESSYVQNGKTPCIIEIQGKTGAFSSQLATLFPKIQFDVQDTSADLISRGQQLLESELKWQVILSQRDIFAPRKIEEISNRHDATVFLLRGVLWNHPDEEVLTILRSILPAMRHHTKPRILISDLVSPTWSTFETHVERAFRRRDVTLMTMHNVQQRTSIEWGQLIQSASPEFKIKYEQRFTSHSCRGLWEVQLED
ncbi:O-methyltransferase [Penicillium nucicola]|uniref:O-methyltransferase n=1 Tax=Penicillium nucicola TaxID=1850975 RepID=UPI0025452A54|nr:O-methyltransferase [Penicillium nucicola]KAJ5749145.1 O-methyltransferase [Penicillium nucicola]